MANVCRSPRVRESPLRILHVQHSLGAGGMENGVVNVANILVHQGFEFHVCCLAYRGEFAGRMPDPGKVHVLAKPNRFAPKAALHLASILRQVRPHVIHTHNIGSLIYTAFATFFGHTYPILHGEHHQPPDPSGISSVLSRLRRSWVYGAASRIHTVSHALRDHFLRLGFDPDKTLALVNGVDTAHFSPGDRSIARAAVGLPLHAPVILVVGRLVASKRHDLLFQAFESVLRRSPDAVLCVVGGGEGPEADRIRSLAASFPAPSQIRIEGFRPDPLPYYRAADILAVPSVTEGLSNAVLEAMSCGLPVLANDACGNRDVIDSGDTGVVADLEEADSLAACLTALMDDRESLATMGRRARESVVARFSLGRMAASYGHVYRLLARRPNPDPEGD